MGFPDSLHTLGTRRIHNGTETNHGKPLSFGATGHEISTKVIANFDGVLVNVGTAQTKNTETVRAEDGNLFNPVFFVDCFDVFFASTSALSLVLALFDHSIGSTLDVRNELAIGGVVTCGRLVDGAHELVVRAEWDLGNNGAIILQLVNVHASKVRSTEDGELSRVSNLAGTSAALADHALTAQNTTRKGRLDPFSGGRFSLLYGKVIVGASNRGSLVGLVSGVKTIGGEVEGGVVSTASIRVVWSIGQDLLSTLLQVLHGAIFKVAIVADKVRRHTVGGIHIVLVTSIGGDKGSERHDVLREGTSFVRTDDGDGSKGFNGREGTDNGVLGCHNLDGIRVGESHNSLKAFRNHGNGADKGNVD
mmetsp:Transcript_1798/g.3405  ORF Transcript_1798/g.3405 Transcript_1798/m.3405 type:complete len:363 (-) Transcript_1798:1031-2119(-)